jgi:D-alanyl-D-alanine dipeptidase
MIVVAPAVACPLTSTRASVTFSPALSEVNARVGKTLLTTRSEHENGATADVAGGAATGADTGAAATRAGTFSSRSTPYAVVASPPTTPKRCRTMPTMEDPLTMAPSSSSSVRKRRRPSATGCA